MTIRSAVASDAGALASLEQALFTRENYPLSRASFYYHIRQSVLLVAETEEGRVAGYILALVRRKRPKLYSLGVLPEFRTHQVASQLMEQLFTELKQRGFPRVILEVRCDNPAAISLYGKFGFHLLRRLDAFYLDGCDAYLMEADLATEALPETL